MLTRAIWGAVMSDKWFAQCSLEADVALYCYGLWVVIMEKLEVAVWEAMKGRWQGLCRVH